MSLIDLFRKGNQKDFIDSYKLNIINRKLTNTMFPHGSFRSLLVVFSPNMVS